MNEQEREAFEAAIRDLDGSSSYLRRCGEWYDDHATSRAWSMWQARAAVSEANSLAAKVPAGYKLVPVEPTPEMLHCAEMWDDGFQGAWSRALAAAPAPEAEPDSEAVTACWQDFGRTEEFRRAGEVGWIHPRSHIGVDGKPAWAIHFPNGAVLTFEDADLRDPGQVEVREMTDQALLSHVLISVGDGLGALDATGHQIGQMRGMFDDSDGTIAEAVAAATEATSSLSFARTLLKDRLQAPVAAPVAVASPLSDAQIVRLWESSTGHKMPNMGSSMWQLLAVARAIEQEHGIGASGEK